MSNADLFVDDAKALTADQLRGLLRRKFPANEYAMLYEVRDGAGFGARRSADVVMVGLWPSRGCQMEGMEIKVSRSDWLRELKAPAKAEAFVPYCDHWWIVTNANVVRTEELPPTWGLMTPGGGSLKVVRQAPRLEAKPIDRSLLAALLKRATSVTKDDPEVRAEIEARAKAAQEGVDQHVKWKTEHLERQLAEMRAGIEAFEKASGIRFNQHRGGDIGEAVRAVMSGEHKRQLNALSGIKRQVARLHEWMGENVADEAQP